MTPSIPDTSLSTTGSGKLVTKNFVTSIPISEEERQSGVPSLGTIGAAVSILHRDGIVVLDNAVSLDNIKALNDKLVSEIPLLIENPNTNWNGGREAGNISQPPPMSPEYMFADIWANPFASAVISSILGPRPHVNYVNGNTSLPCTKGRQNVHADLNFPYPGHMPFAMVANYYLCDTNESNGATEVWLRSHTATHFDMHQKSASWIQEKHLEHRSFQTEYPPIRPAVKAGSVVIRDLRLWHAGRSNPSEDPRIMLAFVHFPYWYQNKLRIKLPESTRPFLESVSDRVIYDVDYVAADVDHTKLEFDANFESNNEAHKATIDKCENTSMASANGGKVQGWTAAKMNGSNGKLQKNDKTEAVEVSVYPVAEIA